VNDFIKKPVENEELQARIRAGIRIIELERALARQNRALSAANREITAANRRMRKELQAAAKIQSSFSSLPPAQLGPGLVLLGVSSRARNCRGTP